MLFQEILKFQTILFYISMFLWLKKYFKINCLYCDFMKYDFTSNMSPNPNIWYVISNKHDYVHNFE